MTIRDLLEFLRPLTEFLGTVLLFAVSVGSVTYAVVWVVRRTWKLLVALGVTFFAVFVMILYTGGFPEAIGWTCPRSTPA